MDRALALARMAQLLLRRGVVARVRRDPSGGWWQSCSDGVLVTPTLRSLPWPLARSYTWDLFYHRYRPRPGDVVLEVGAGCGTETVFLAESVGRNGRVIAVEAHPWTFRLLCRTVAENGLENVTPVHVAVTDSCGRTSISDHEAASNILNSVLAGGPGHTVRSTTIDRLVDEHRLDRVDLLKMNIEGAEALAVRGMRTSSPLIRNAVISCHDFLADRTGDDAYRTREDVRRALERLGFDLDVRSDDPRPWVRDYLYCSRPGEAGSATPAAPRAPGEAGQPHG